MRALTIICLGIALLVNVSCSSYRSCCDASDCCGNIDEITRTLTFHSLKLQKEKQLELLTSCVDYDGGIRSVDLRFQSHDLLTLPQARALIVDVVEGVLKVFNESYILREDLYELPMTERRLHIVITFDSFYGKYVDLDYTNRVILDNGSVEYYTFDAYNYDKEVWSRHCEPYYSALIQVDTMKQMDAPYFEEEVKTGIQKKSSNQFFISPP